MSLKGLRIITNLHCNNNCNFCYQRDKSNKILDINYLLTQVSGYDYKQFEYCTIMGGESTLLPNLAEYVKIGSLFARETRLTTNGKLLTSTMIDELEGVGLNGINISIATIDPDEYKIIHGTDCDLRKLFDVIDKNQDYFNFRVNIPLCKENCENDYSSLKEVLDLFVVEGYLNVTMCEDIKGTYSLYNQFEKIGAVEVSRTDYGLIFLDYKGHKIGYYTHRNNNYNTSDLVVTPLGTWENWDGYCKAVGMNV